MANKKTIITGRGGVYQAEFLLALGYTVYSAYHRISSANQ